MEQLSPEDQAVLSLVLGRGLGFAQVGRMLRMRESTVRQRARQAALHLAPSPPPVSDAERDEIADYLVEAALDGGREAPSVIHSSAAARDWATALAARLAPFSDAPLAALPEPKEMLSGLRWLWTTPVGARVAAVLLGAIIAVAIVLVVTGRFSSGPANTATAAPHTVRDFALAAAKSEPSAAGSAVVVRRGRSLSIRVSATGLPPNHQDFYALWLYNSQADSKLLGIVWPPVGSNGHFSSDTELPADSIRYQSLIVTHETTVQPAGPGAIVLRGALALS